MTIISASRRTDIPAFYAEWMIRRLRAEYCTVPNPLNRNQVSTISLRPEDVDAIVFWTRNPRPLMAHLEELDARGYRYYFQYTIVGNPLEPRDESQVGLLMRELAECAHANGMDIVSCAEEIDLRPYGIRPGKCVDDQLIAVALGVQVTGKKDPAQREACGCVVSGDIGMYDSCVFGCQYCYATRDFDQARFNLEQHDPNSPSLLGWHEPISD